MFILAYSFGSASPCIGKSITWGVGIAHHGGNAGHSSTVPLMDACEIGGNQGPTVPSVA